MVSNEEFFGINAGVVWQALKNHGPMNAGKLIAVTELGEADVRGALGWLGREGKIRIEKGSKNFVYSLIEN